MLLRSSSDRPIDACYEFFGRLGHGGFGSVFRARSLQTGEERAVKEIPLSGIQDDMDFVHAELEALIRLNHPNVVKLYEFFEGAQVLYLVTEICTEGDFSALNNGINDPLEITLLFRDLMLAVAYCHDHGIAHRDLKFSNCLLQKAPGLRRVTKVIDFGLAAIRRPEDEADGWLSELLGSELFVAPEVIEGDRHYGVKCDCWSVGVMLYVVLTQEHPFAADEAASEPRKLFRAIVKGRMRKRPLDVSVVDGAARDLILKLLVKDPEARLDARSVLDHDWLRPALDRATWRSSSQADMNELSLWTFSALRKQHPLTKQMLSRMLAFPNYTRFERALLTLVAHYAKSKDVEDLRSAFEELNTSKSGSLSKEEIQEGIKTCGFQLRDEEVDDIFKSLDAERTGKIHYTKWLSATVRPSLLSSAKMMDQVYTFFDPAQNGKASKDELCQLLGCDATVDECPNETEFKALMNQVAKNLESQCRNAYVGADIESEDECIHDDGVRAWLGMCG